MKREILTNGKNSSGGRHKADLSLTRVRSAITNGSALLADVDHRSGWMRRLRDIIKAHEADAGGPDILSEGQRAIIRRAALLQLQLEMMERLGDFISTICQQRTFDSPSCLDRSPHLDFTGRLDHWCCCRR